MIIIKKITVDDSVKVMDLIQTVHDNMEKKEWYVIDDLEYYSHYLEEGKGVGYKALDTEKNVLAGIFIAIIPDTKELNLGYDANLSEEECKKVAVMDTVAILPEYRGQNLQYRLMLAAEAKLKERGYRYLMRTVHPDKHFSLRNVLKQNCQIVATKEKYGACSELNSCQQELRRTATDNF